jgi:PAS domain S-box-containing protein
MHGGRTLRILVVDDNPDDRALVTRELSRLTGNIEIVGVGTPAELERAISGAIDLAIVDYTLGWSNGMAVFQTIKNVSADARGIMFTGTLGEEFAVEAVKGGFDDYITKHIDHLARLGSVSRNLLAQKSQFKALRRAEQSYQKLFKSVTVGLFSCRRDGSFVDGNPMLCTMLGLTGPASLEAKNFFDFVFDSELRGLWNRIENESISSYPLRVAGPDGAVMCVLLDAYPVLDDGEAMIEGVVTDISALRAVEEKTALLREIYHRVNNNLQFVLSLLAIQARRFEDPQVKTAFREVGERLRSLSLIQQQLYLTQEFSSVDFEVHLLSLIKAIALANDDGTVLDVVAEKLRVPVDLAVPLGLIANELITNAFKHGLAVDGQRAIRLRLRRVEGAGFLEIGNEASAPPLVASPSREGLGKSLIRSLAKTVGATVETNTCEGFTTTVRFPL